MTSAHVAIATRPHLWCSFLLGDECFAVDAAAVVEVLRSRQLTRVPLADRGVLGLVHLRGRIVPVIDPAEPLAVHRRPEGLSGTTLVIESAAEWYGLLVDDMLDVVEIPPARVERPTGGTALVLGTFAAADRLVHLLDPDRMIQSLTRQRPATGRVAPPVPEPWSLSVGGTDGGVW